MFIIGERLNSARKSICEAFQARDEKFLIDQALRQEQAGAHYIDLNAAALLDHEIEILRWAIPVLQKNLKVPISLDTPNPEAMEEGLKCHKGKALLNSLTAEKNRLYRMLPIIRDFKPQIIVLCLDEEGTPRTPEKSVQIAEQMVNLLQREGIRLEDLFVDPLVRPVGVEWDASPLFLESIGKIKASLPGVKTIAGISNISFGLPRRSLFNRTLLVLALQQGLDAAICDPLDAELQASLAASQALLGKDPGLKNFLTWNRKLKRQDRTDRENS
ncbi:MAG: dihydropteroate synthase [Candidatus Aminicenantales bacterium]